VRDVLIVGGGPAGLYAGWQLARAGFDVEIVEEHPRVGQPVHCTGVLAADAFERFGVPDDAILNTLRTVRFHAPSGDSISYSTPTVEAVAIDRARFDAAIAERACAAGARVAAGERVTSVDVGDDGVTVGTSARTIRARLCVLACGARYAVQRQRRLGVPRLLLHTAQAELPAEQLGDVEVYFGTGVAPRGFAWAVPVRRERPHVRVGVMCERDAGAYFARVLTGIADRWGIADPSRCVPRQKILPLGPIGRTFSDRLLVVGDAAGVVKPTTGGGIYYSLLTASFAAETIVDAFARGDLSASMLREYEGRWRRRLGSELRWQLVMRRIAHRLTDREINGLFELARTDGLMPLVRRTAAFNQHRDFIVALLKHPPARRVLFKAALA
jgi:geranylgeranyl reductase family protein